MFDQLTEIIVNYVEVQKEDIKPESRFIEDLGFTSFDFMSMLGEIEDEMDVEIDQEAGFPYLKRRKTYERIAQYTL